MATAPSAAPVSYPAGRGAYQIVVGDFTRDGLIDIATGNRSTVYRDDCGPGAKTWDSISILPGHGNGTFTEASSFSVGNQTERRQRPLPEHALVAEHL